MTTKNRGITPLNADTFDIKQVEISDSGNEFADYGFTKYHFSQCETLLFTIQDITCHNTKHCVFFITKYYISFLKIKN